MAEDQPTIPPRQPPAAGDDETTFFATGIVSGRDGRPLVDLRWGQSHGLLSPHELANHVQMLMREAWWADSDAALVKFLKERLELDVERAAIVLNDFRQFRVEQLDAAAKKEVERHRAHYAAEAAAAMKRRGEKGQ